jgi:phage protein D
VTNSKENKAKAKESEKAAGKMKAMAKKMEEGLQGRRRNRWKKTKMLRQVLDNY